MRILGVVTGYKRPEATTKDPRAKIVYDKFHLISNYNTVIDKIRRAQWRAAGEQDKTFIKGQRYNLFRNLKNPCPVEYIHATIPWGEPE